MSDVSVCEREMRAVLYEGPHRMRVVDVPVPAPGADEVLVRVEAAGICGSEVEGYTGASTVRHPPLVMGHELAGTVVRSHRDAPDQRWLGARVAVIPLVTCGRCQACATGRSNLCPDRALLSVHRAGGFARYVVVPARNLVPLPDALSYETGALLEPLACAVHSLRRAPVREGRMVLIGAGPLGYLHVLEAQADGLHDIVVIETDPARAVLVAALGVEVIGHDPDLATSTLRAALVVDAVGTAATRALAVELASPGGCVVFAGMHGEAAQINGNTVIRRELTVTGTFCYTVEDWHLALSRSAHADRVASLAEIAPLARAPLEFARLAGRGPKPFKVILRPAADSV